MSNKNMAVKTAYFSIFGNAGLALIKGIAGILGNSFALVADAIESTTDIFSSLLVLFGLKYAQRPPDKNHPYGHGKIEPLITFVVVAFLVTSATIIAVQSIQNIQTPHEMPEPWTLLVLLGIIIWKEGSYQIVIRRSKELKSSSLKADAWHHRSDAITSVAAFIGISIALVLGEGHESLDDWAALFAAALILYNSYHIFRPALGEVMDESVYDELVDEIREIAQEVQGITGTEKCYVRKAGMNYHLDLHAWVDGAISVTSGHALAHSLKDTLKKRIPMLGEVHIHIEPHNS
ncbi:MAG: cation diffusion facilitator family transporter [Salinivirgaceae bacterium]|jgi:cation diffusion facilitator family transporter|nr:cation diffusion facilitator family transporter [Salinivirgaceae bacterium]